MYNLQKAFENSLRTFHQSPDTPKHHTSCKGSIHATGTYRRPQRPPPPSKKSNSLSSECCSDTDTESVSHRLHLASTQASSAKTARMRYQDPQDSASLRGDEKRRRHKRKEILRKVLAQDANSRDVKNGVVVLQELLDERELKGLKRRKMERTWRRLSSIRAANWEDLMAAACNLNLHGNGVLKSWEEILRGRDGDEEVFFCV